MRFVVKKATRAYTTSSVHVAPNTNRRLFDMDPKNIKVEGTNHYHNCLLSTFL